MGAGPARSPRPPTRTADDASPAGARTPEVDRRRLALMIKVAASAGDFSPQLAHAVEHATDFEVQVMADLVARGMSIPHLVNVLQGAHVVVGDEDLYERWIFPTSRRRLSSHHRYIDKKASPDYGLAGPLVRESLHGRAQVGTWVQLERSMATFQFGRLPTWSDVEHLRDYVIYRITGKNVGPWGLSAHVDTRPMVLRPPNRTGGRAAGRALAEFARRRAEVELSDEDRSRWSVVLIPDVEPVGPVGDLFTPPAPEDPVDLLPDAPYKDELGLGLFGSLRMVSARVTLAPGVLAAVEDAATGFGPAAAGSPEVVTVPSARDGAGLRVRATVQESVRTRPVFVGIEEEL